MKPSSCDTFVALPPSTEGQRIIFGKNSDRPCDEVQEVVYFPARDYNAGEKLEVRESELISSSPELLGNNSLMAPFFLLGSAPTLRSSR